MQLILLLLQVILLSSKVIQERDKSLSYNIHLYEERFLLGYSMSGASDVMLIHHGVRDGLDQQHLCRVKQRGVDLETQEIDLIDSSSFNESEFDPETPLNLKQFIGMSHIDDGVLAVSSDMFVYMLKFDYKSLHQNINETKITEQDEDYQPKFASLIWRADLQKVAPTLQSKSEVPNLVYNQKHNVAFLAFSDSVCIFSVTEMETNLKQLSVVQSGQWQSRKIRGWTKSKDNMVYSAVGHDGLDLYLIDGVNLEFVTTITSKTLWTNPILEKKALYIVDLAIVSCDSIGTPCQHVFIMDQHNGLLVVEVLYSNKKALTYTLLMDGIGQSNNGIAVETIDGKVVLAAYHHTTSYETIEFQVDLKNHTWEVYASYLQRSKVIDIRMNEDLAVVQGVNHHQIIFTGLKADYKYYSMAHPINVRHGGMRDFDFFKKSQMKQQVNASDFQHLRDDNRNFDDFMFGVSKEKLFVSRYRVTKPMIECYTEDESLSGNKYSFTAVYNTTTCDEHKVPEKDVVCQHLLNFSVEVVSTLLYHNKVVYVLVIVSVISLIIISLFICLMVLYKRFRDDSHTLAGQLSQYQRNNNKSANFSQQGNQIQMEQSVEMQKPPQ